MTVLDCFGVFAPLINAFYELLAYISAFFSITMQGLSNMVNAGYLYFGFTNVFTGELRSFYTRSTGGIADIFYTVAVNVLESVGNFIGIPSSAPLYVWLFVGIGSVWLITAVFLAFKRAFFS